MAYDGHLTPLTRLENSHDAQRASWRADYDQTVLRQMARIASATIRSGPNAVALTRGAKRRGAAQKTREFAALVSRLRGRNLSVVVEIGTLRGGTLWAWCQIARPDALLVSIDLPGGDFGGGYQSDDSDRLRGFARETQTVELIRDDSHADRTLVQLRKILAEKRIDLLFIDGDHTYNGVRSDYEMYAPLVADDGLIVLHDILAHPGDPTCEVDRLWDELRESARVEEFVDLKDVRARGQWGGIGVVYPL